MTNEIIQYDNNTELTTDNYQSYIDDTKKLNSIIEQQKNAGGWILGNRLRKIKNYCDVNNKPFKEELINIGVAR